MTLWSSDQHEITWGHIGPDFREDIHHENAQFVTYFLLVKVLHVNLLCMLVSNVNIHNVVNLFFFYYELDIKVNKCKGHINV